MGRQLRRVPLNFDHPVGVTWPGFLNPHYTATKCEACDGSGYSPAGKRYKDEWYGYVPFDPASTGSTPFSIDQPVIVAMAKRNAERMNCSLISLWRFYGSQAVEEAFGARQIDNTPWDEVLPGLGMRLEKIRLMDHFNASWSHHLAQEDVDALVEAGRLMDFTHQPRNEEQANTLKAQESGGGSGYWLTGGNGYRPTAAEVNEWSLQGFGHDSVNQWVCVKARCARNGEETSCAVCDGHGHIWANPEDEARYDAWEATDPPTGSGYQMWETVSEGSPISPVFQSPEALALWLAGDTTSETSYEAWMGMICGAGWAPSLISGPETNGVPVDGATALHLMETAS